MPLTKLLGEVGAIIFCFGVAAILVVFTFGINMSEVINSFLDNMQDKREEMMQQIKSYNFAVIELALYLDTHPDDTKALCLHNKYCKELKELKDKYQKVYGPLSIYFPCNKWRWLEEPWPWEGGNY